MKSQFKTLLLAKVMILGSVSADQQTDLLNQLQQDMQHYSDLATETNQNVDYMPYVISVMNNEDLVALGVTNLREAVSLVPGVDLTVGMAGVKNPIFRGSNPYAFGQSKLIIDGMVVNDQIFGGYNQYLAMPVDIIHRIEVVRGPGSMLSHVNGYAGAIHVITKANRDDKEEVKNEAFAYAGSDDLAAAGLINQVEIGEGHLSTDVYYQEHDLILPVGEDRFGNSGEVDQGLENYQIGVNYKNGGLEIKARRSNNESGVSYGQAFSLSEDDSDYLDVANNLFEIKYGFMLNQKASLEIALNYNDEDRELQNKVMPDGAMMMGMTLMNGRYFLVDYEEETISQRVQLNYVISDSHKIVIGAESRQSEIKENTGAVSNTGLATVNEFDLFSTDERNVDTFFVEDLINITEKTSIQFGAKYSDYDDVDDESSIRLAMVHRYNDENIFKAMFSQAYREPSWREQYLNAQAFFNPNIDIESENVDAYELAYINKSAHRDFIKVNLFLLKNDQQIDAQNSLNTFNNSDDNELYGFEFEYEKTLFDRDVFSVNYSHIEGDNVTDALANSASDLARIYYLYRFSDNLQLSPLVNYIGSKERVLGDNRDDVDDYILLDLTAKYSGIAKGLDISLSVKNIADKTYYLPSPNGTYEGDFEQTGRTWMIRMSKEF